MTEPEFKSTKTLIVEIFDEIFACSLGGNIDYDSAKFTDNSVQFRTWEHDKEFLLELKEIKVSLRDRESRKKILNDEK